MTGGQSSVIYDKQFDLFEFNEFKKGNLVIRESQGLWRTARDILLNIHEPVAFPLQERTELITTAILSFSPLIVMLRTSMESSISDWFFTI